MKTATKIKDLDGFAGHAALYKLSQPIKYERWGEEDEKPEQYEHVIVSAASVMFSGPETYIFGANEAGEITNWTELDGSFRGGLDHEAALRGAGYEIA